MTTRASRWLLAGIWRLVVARAGGMLLPVFLMLAAHGAWAAGSASAPEAVRAQAVELRLMDRPVAEFRAVLGGALPADRASRARAMFDSLSEAQLAQPLGRVRASVGDINGVVFRLGDRLLFALTEGDLDPAEGLTIDAAADQVGARVQAAIDARRQQMHWPNLVRGGVLSVVGLAVLVGLAWGIGRMRNGVRARLQAALETHVLRRAGSQFDWTGALYQLVSRIVQIFAIGLVAVLAFLWFQFVMEQFPITQPTGDRMGEFILSLLSHIALGAVEAIPGIITVAVILLITRALQTLVSNVFVAVQKGQITVPGLHPETAGATRRLAGVVVWALGFTFAYPYIPGSQSDVFKGLSVLIGFMVTLGSANVVNQLMSGMVVVYSRALRRGDMVSIGDTVGTVAGLDALSVKIINLRNEEVTLPNAVVVGSAIHNFSRHGTARQGQAVEDPRGALVSTSVTIGYDSPWRQIHAMLLAAASRAKHVVAEPTPFVLQRGLSDYYVEYELFVALDHPRNRFYALSALHAAIQDEFNTHGVQIMSPHFLGQPEQAVVVPKEDWFRAPGHPGIDPAARSHGGAQASNEAAPVEQDQRQS